MIHILSFKLFESPEIGQIISNSPFEISKKVIDTKPIASFVISDDLSGINKFDIKYDNIIRIIYNNTEKHILFGDKRLFQRTPFYSITEFNMFIENIFNMIYPNYFFEDVDNLNDIDISNYKINQDNNKTFLLNIEITNKKDNLYIPYTLTKKYNESTDKFEFFIYIITITTSRDENRIYKEFNFTYNSEYNEIDFINTVNVGVLPFIKKDIKYLIDELKTDEIISMKYNKSKNIIEDTTKNIVKNNTNKLSKKDLTKILKKR